MSTGCSSMIHPHQPGE